jgi:hypothetical protein
MPGLVEISGLSTHDLVPSILHSCPSLQSSYLGAELERIKGGCKGMQRSTAVALFCTVSYCSVKSFKISVGVAAPTSYNSFARKHECWHWITILLNNYTNRLIYMHF